LTLLIDPALKWTLLSPSAASFPNSPSVVASMGGGVEDVPSCHLDGRGAQVPGPQLHRARKPDPGQKTWLTVLQLKSSSAWTPSVDAPLADWTEFVTGPVCICELLKEMWGSLPSDSVALRPLKVLIVAADRSLSSSSPALTELPLTRFQNETSHLLLCMVFSIVLSDTYINNLSLSVVKTALWVDVMLLSQCVTVFAAGDCRTVAQYWTRFKNCCPHQSLRQ